MRMIEMTSWLIEKTQDSRSTLMPVGAQPRNMKGQQA